MQVWLIPGIIVLCANAWKLCNHGSDNQDDQDGRLGITPREDVIQLGVFTDPKFITGKQV